MSSGRRLTRYDKDHPKPKEPAMTDELVERVAEEIRKIYYDDAPIVESPSKDAARAAIAIALEEAAKVADENACDCCFYIAAAIRAMIPNGNDRAPDDTGSAE